METDENKVQYLIKMINDMDIKDRLRLAIRMNESDYILLNYDKEEEFKKYDTLLKEIDEEYRTTLLNFRKFFNVGFAIAKLFEMSEEQQNQIALFIFNSINQKIIKKRILLFM